MKTYSAKPSEISRKWYVIDASQNTLGRISTEAAQLLTGKGKPTFTKHIDCGDFVVIINSDKLKITGNKLEDKVYYRHTGYPGGIKSRTLKEQMSLGSESVIEKSIRGMLPVNKLRDGRLKRLKIYSGAEHNHSAQKPTILDLKKGKK